MIERLHFEEGVTLATGERIQSQVVKLMLDNKDKVKQLPEGEYDITPNDGSRDFAQNKLKVLGNGCAIYVVVLTDEKAGTINLAQESHFRIKSGNDVSYLPKDNVYLGVAGMLLDKKTTGLYEILHHVPGPSPKKLSKNDRT
jgi:hypothetical protein